MARRRPVRIGLSVSRLAVALVAAGALLAASAVLAQSSRAGSGEVIAIRELQLKPGASVPEFERFVTGTYNPAWEGAVPGVKGYIAKSDRGAQKNGYALIFVFDSERTRNAIFPKEGGGAAERFLPFLEGPTKANTALEQYIEPGTLSVYVDYVVLR